MDIVVFDLDNTLVNTNCCQYYLRSQAGRDVVSEHVSSGLIKLNLYDENIVEYFNFLVECEFITVLVISDSPKDYCLSVLKFYGFKIDDDHIFGSQGKPCVKFYEILEGLRFKHGRDFSDDPVLIIGDSPKDIFFGYCIKAPSVFATWGTTFDVNYVRKNSLPEAVAENLNVLEEAVEAFFKGELKFKERDFSQHFLTVDELQVDKFEFPEEDAGFAREYVPDWSEFRNEYDRFVWFDVNRSIKKAKFLTPAELQQNTKLRFYTQDGGVSEGKGFKTNAGHYIKDFKGWLSGRGVKGKIALIPMPSSLPRECNLSNVMDQLCSWWASWINQDPSLP
jgi:phosphoglycolate phosphatase-like HAD superfamily hydrolase